MQPLLAMSTRDSCQLHTDNVEKCFFSLIHGGWAELYTFIYATLNVHI